MWPAVTVGLSNSTLAYTRPKVIHSFPPKMPYRGFLHCGAHAAIRSPLQHNPQACELAQQVKVPAVNAEDLGSIPKAHMVEGKDRALPNVVLHPSAIPHSYILQQHKTVHSWTSNNCQPRILYPTRLPFINSHKMLQRKSDWGRGA